MRVLLIIPAYNEEANVVRVVETVRAFAPDSADWRPDSEMLMFHQRGGSRANRRMLEMLEGTNMMPGVFYFASGDV